MSGRPQQAEGVNATWRGISLTVVFAGSAAALVLNAGRVSFALTTSDSQAEVTSQAPGTLVSLERLDGLQQVVGEPA